jgi:glutathione synthase
VTRVLVAGGEVITSYERFPLSVDHRSGGGDLKRIDSLDAQEHSLAVDIAQRLGAYGVHFAGLDMVYPYILEVNLVNPGGIQNAPEPRARELANRAVDSILANYQRVSSERAYGREITSS